MRWSGFKAPKISLGSTGKWNSARALFKDAALPMMEFRPRSVVGVDIGSGTIKAVRIECDKGRASVSQWSMRQHSGGNEKRETGLLRQDVMEVLEGVGGAGDHLALNLSGPEVRFHQITLPSLRGEELESAVQWQVKKEIGDEAAEINIAFTTQEIQTGLPEEMILVLAVSVPSVFIHTVLDALGNLRVHRIGVTAGAYANLLAGFHPGKEGEGYAVVDIGNDETWVCIFRRGGLVYARRIGVTGRHFTSALTQPVQTPEGPLRYSREEAERIKSEKTLNIEDFAGQGDSPDYFSVLLRPAVEKLSAEIERTLVHFVNANVGDLIGRVYLSGGGALLKGLPEALKGRLGMPVERLDFGRLHAVDESVLQPMGEERLQLAGAIGSALGWASGVNLVPATRRTTPAFAVAQTFLFWGGAVLLASIPFLTGLAELGVSALEADVVQAETRYAAMEPRRARLGELALGRERLQAGQALVSVLPEGQDVLPQVLKELGGRLRPGMVLNGLCLEGGNGGDLPKLSLAGEVHGSTKELDATLLEFLLELRGLPFYRDPVVTLKKQIHRDGEKGIEFQITCDLDWEKPGHSDAGSGVWE
ncbi:MAG: pilus assembly protein PilM [Candidatus Eisenbacteria sp.]|nr:pilus assembly protein PilM [Candidatus Eisenbacteria bacterium]